MIRFLGRRMLQALFTLLAASFLLFFVTSFSPGNIASKILGPYASDVQVEILKDKLSLDDPLLVRYGDWLAILAGLKTNPLGDEALGLALKDPRGDRYFGNLSYSLMLNRPVVDAIGARIGYTALLAFWTFVFMIPVALILSVIAGVRAGSMTDRTVTLGTLIATSLPEFATGVALLLVFVHWFGWLPGTSHMLPGAWSQTQQLVLPVAVLVLTSASYVARIVRASVAETMREDYVRMAVLKGVSRLRLILAHVLRNALIAPVTVILLQLNWLLSGVVVAEAIFAYPGIGTLLLEAAKFGDLYTVQGLTLLALAVAVGTQVAGDLIYLVLDPRIRLQ